MSFLEQSENNKIHHISKCKMIICKILLIKKIIKIS